MPYSDQSQFDVRSEWGAQGLDALAECAVVIIVDVLSFTTSVEIAVSRGATVFPYPLGADGAAEYAAQRNAIVAHKRSEIPGQMSLSPASLEQAQPGTRLVLPSPNGSALSVQARDSGATVIAASLRNASAVAAMAANAGGPIAVIPAGERWEDRSLRPAYEDAIGAGAVISRLPGSRSPEAQLLVAAFNEARPRLASLIHDCASGRELRDRGFSRDVELASQLDVSETVPVLHENAYISQISRDAVGR